MFGKWLQCLVFTMGWLDLFGGGSSAVSPGLGSELVEAARIAEAPGDCETLGDVLLRDIEGHRFSVRWRRCGEDPGHVLVCDGDACYEDTCDPGLLSLDGVPDGWTEAPQAWPQPDGRQDVLVVRRFGQGAYPQITRYTVRNGAPICEPMDHLDPMTDAVAAEMEDGQVSFGGADVQVVGNELLVALPIFKQHDPNCCPTGGFAELWIDQRKGEPHLARVERRGGMGSPSL